MKRKEITTTLGNPHLHNPHLDGDAFFWQGGSTGILLSHGFTATTAEIRPLAEMFHAQGYTIATPLLPGHGTQPEDLNQVKWQDWVKQGKHLSLNSSRFASKFGLRGNRWGVSWRCILPASTQIWLEFCSTLPQSD